MRRMLWLLLLLPFSLSAQKKKSPPPPPPAPDYNATYSALHWRNIGPFRGGRANAIAGHPTNPNIYYTGYTGGGIWKTTDGGLSWHNISDGFFQTGTIGDIAIAESDPNVIYAGSGEHAVRGVMTSYGDGVYKSTDGGATWKNMGLSNTRHIADIVIDPRNPDHIWVAAQGTVHGPSSDRGVYKSTDGGITWRKTLFINDSTGISSLSLDMNNPRILYAASWQHQRLPWTVNSGGPGCALWKSTDGGETWNKITNGLPAQLGKMGIAVSRANSNRVFAIVESEKVKSGLYRSDDGGNSWNLLSTNQDISARSWYYMEVTADPLNENIVYVMNAPLMRSIDGGKTFAPVRIQHGDTHDLWINPRNSNNIALADDGGGSISYNQGASWSSLNNQPTAQFYRVNTDNVFPYKVYGGQQDNSSVIIASRNNGMGLTERDWTAGPGCESAFLAFDPQDPTLVMGGCYQGFIEVLDTRTREIKDVQAHPSLSLAIQPKKLKYRFNWNAPIVASKFEKGTFYHGGNVVLKTANAGLQWEVISPDLTRNDTLHQGPGGGPLTNEGAGGENYNTLSYMIESPLEKGVLWTGSDCGLVYRTADGGKNWVNVTPQGLEECLIHSIELSPHDPNTAFVSATRYKFNDYASYTYRTTDNGKTWTRIVNGIAAADFVRVIREDLKTKGTLYAGAERGFYISFDNGDNWQHFQLNLPVVPVTDLMIRDNDLVAATAGRAFWILDDIGILQQSGKSLPASATRIFTPKPAYRFGGGGELGSGVNAMGVGENAPEGVILDYYLAAAAGKDTISLTIADASGKAVRRYTNIKNPDYKPYPGGPQPAPVLPAEKGLNRFLWNFQTEPISPDVNGVFIFGSYNGHRMPPGNYTATLKTKDTTVTTSIQVLQDPRLQANPADWAAQHQYLDRVSNDISTIHKKVNALRTIRKQVETYNGLLKDNAAGKDVLKAGQELVAALTAWEDQVVESRIKNGQDVINWPSKLNAEFFFLHGLADTHNPIVTEGLKASLNDLEAKWEKLQTEYDTVLVKKINAYNELFKSSNLPAVIQ